VACIVIAVRGLVKRKISFLRLSGSTPSSMELISGQLGTGLLPENWSIHNERILVNLVI
jgi:hypothetical protein